MTRTEKILEALGIPIARRRGNRAWTFCPFHEQEHPDTFFIRTAGPRAGQCHCFSCKSGGSIIDLVMHVRRCSFKEAKAFTEKAGKGFELPKARFMVIARPPSLGRSRFRIPSEVIFEPLSEWVSGASRYIRGRGFTDEEVASYGLGYAVNGTLAGRVVFVVRGWPDGHPASYQARTFVDETPKYRTPHEKEEPDLDVLFGEHLWPELVRDTVVVTEGAINACIVRRITGFHIAGLGGSEVQPGHVLSLATFKRVVILTDPDAAGEHAARVLRSSLGRHVTTVRPKLPPEVDAADMAIKLGQPERLRDIILSALATQAA